jgi:hypothetical protein
MLALQLKFKKSINKTLSKTGLYFSTWHTAFLYDPKIAMLYFCLKY